MSMINELNSELVMAIANRLENGKEIDRQAMRQVLRQVEAALQPLSEADRHAKLAGSPTAFKLGENLAANGR